MATTRTIIDAAILPPFRVVPPLVIASVGAVAVGLLTRRRDLVRGGMRLGAVQLAASAIDAVVHRVQTHGDGVATPPPVVVDAMAIWLADTVVNAALERLDPLSAVVVDPEPASRRPA